MVTVALKLLVTFEIKCADGWMVGYLLEVELNTADCALMGLAEDRVEGFLDCWANSST